MPRVIPSQLQEHLDSGQTTTTFLLKITPVTAGYPAYGVTFGNQSIEYDDGSGVLEYSASVGMQPSTIAQNLSLGINNAESTSLIPEFDIPVSESDIRAGVYDFATFSLYLVNYEDLDAGHVEIHSGTIGQVTIRSDGLSFVNELRGLVAQLKQSIIEKDSLTCRAQFGSQEIGSMTPGPQVSFGWCGFDATTLLVSDNVLDVGTETTLTFRVTPDSGWMDGHLAPGIVNFTSGLNAGRTLEISDNTADGWITLADETPFPISVGDSVDYRPDCNKHARDEEKGCKKHFGANWIEHFRGEPDIPIADAAAMSVPGAGVGPGQGGPTDVPLEQE